MKLGGILLCLYRSNCTYKICLFLPFDTEDVVSLIIWLDGWDPDTVSLMTLTLKEEKNKINWKHTAIFPALQILEDISELSSTAETELMTWRDF